MRRRFELSDLEWLVIKPLLPNKPQDVPRAPQTQSTWSHNMRYSGMTDTSDPTDVVRKIRTGVRKNNPPPVG